MLHMVEEGLQLLVMYVVLSFGPMFVPPWVLLGTKIGHFIFEGDFGEEVVEGRRGGGGEEEEEDAER